MLLISGKFVGVHELPINKRYLLKYFLEEVDIAFVCYFVVFGNYTRFIEHTGFEVTDRWLRKLKRKFVTLEKAREKARADNDSAAVALIESGNYEIYTSKM